MATLLGALGWLLIAAWKRITRRWREDKRRREQDRAVRAGVRALLDAERWDLEMRLYPHAVTAKEWRRLDAMLHEVSDAREALWVADGNQSRRADGDTVRELKHLRTTMRLVKTKDGWQQQDVFAKSEEEQQP